MIDKEFFKATKKYSLEFANSIEEGFPYFCLSIFFPTLSEDEIDNSVYSLSGNDDSIDSFLVNEDLKELYFIQFKSARSLESMGPASKEWFAYLYDIPNKLKNDKYMEKHTNTRVVDIATDFLSYSKKGYETKFILYHLGWNPNPELIDSYKNLDYFSFKDIKDQYMEYESMRATTEPESIDLKLTYNVKPDVIEMKIGKYKTLISLITGDEIVKLRRLFKYKLFDKNLRFSLGNNKINKSIVHTAKVEKHNFYFFNNGITIASKGFKYRPNSNSVRIDYPQIINGAQTVNAIYTAFSDDFRKTLNECDEEKEADKKTLEAFKELKVFFRIISNPKDQGEFERKVIEYNNTQNIIQKRDFYANAPEQIELQRIFCKHGYFYEIKRGEREYIKKDNHNILDKRLKDFKHREEKIDIEKLASVWMAYYVSDPSSKSVGKDRIFGTEKFYELIFPERKEMIKDELVKEMILAYNIYDIIDNEAKIFRGVNAIQSLLANINNPSKFAIAKKSVQDSLIFNNTLKSKFDNSKVFNKNKEGYSQKIRAYTPFAQGKYFTLAVFKLIIDECNYLGDLISSGIFEKKEFIKIHIIKHWLITIIDQLIIPEFNQFAKEIGSSQSAFYLRSQNFENIKDRFKTLDVDLDKEFREIFPLIIS